MSAKSLFNVIVKVFGIYFIKDIITSIPTLLKVFYSFGDGDTAGAVSTLLISIFALFVYSVIAYYFIFRTEQVMQTLRLLENVPEDPVPLNIHRSTVVGISLLIVAFYLIIQAIPLLIRGLTKWYQYNKMSRRFSALEPFDYSTVYVYAAEIIVALLLIVYQQTLVNYI